MFVKFTIKTAVLFFAAAALTVLFSGKPAWALTAEVTPQNIPIKLFYHGDRLTIDGKCALNEDLIVKISNTPGEAHMKFKGKAGGIFWMKIGDISFANVPTAYLLATSQNLDSMLSREEQIKEGIGFEAIKEGAEIESSAEGMDKAQWINEFINFKKEEKLYRVEEGTITNQNGKYHLEMEWPFQAAPDTYNIEVLAVRDGKIVDRAESNLTVERAGIVAQLTELAFNQAAVYGIIAIVIAMVAGFAVGVLFKGGGAH